MYTPIRTIAELQAKAPMGTPEGTFLEFKLCLPAKDVAPSLASFANCLGGTILLGVATSKDQHSGLDAVTGYPGVPTSQIDSTVQAVTQSAAQMCRPQPQISIEQIDVGSNRVIVINVEPSAALVAVVKENSWRFATRTLHGTEWLTYEDVVARLAHPSRLPFLHLTQLFTSSAPLPKPILLSDGYMEYRSVAGRLSSGWHHVANARATLLSFNDRTLTLSIEQAAPFVVPLSLVDEIWGNPSGPPSLLLRCRVKFEPDKCPPGTSVKGVAWIESRSAGST